MAPIWRNASCPELENNITICYYLCMQNVYNSFKQNIKRHQFVLLGLTIYLFLQLLVSLWLTGFSSVSLFCLLLWLPVTGFELHFSLTATAEFRNTMTPMSPEYRNMFDRDFAKLCPMEGGGITRDFVVSTCWDNRISLGRISNVVRAYSGFSQEAMQVVHSGDGHVISPNIFIFFNDNSCIKIKCKWSDKDAADRFLAILKERNPSISTTPLPEDSESVRSHNPSLRIAWTIGAIAYIVLTAILVVFLPL